VASDSCPAGDPETWWAWLQKQFRYSKYRAEFEEITRCLPECTWEKYLSTDCDLVEWKGDRSPDFRVPDLPDEGWKFSVGAGTTFGRVAKLVPQTVIDHESDPPTTTLPPSKSGKERVPPIEGKSESHRSGTELVELGYLRTSDWWVPNYIGSGVKIVNNARTEIYPLVVGSFHLPESRLDYFGLMAEMGVRIDDPYLKVNPSSSSKYSLLFNIPAEFGWEFYPPFSFFFRADLFGLDLTGVGSKNPVSVKGYPFYLGDTSLTAGVRLDFAGVLQ